MIMISRVLKLPDEVQAVIDQQNQKAPETPSVTHVEAPGSIESPLVEDTVQTD